MTVVHDLVPGCVTVCKAVVLRKQTRGQRATLVFNSSLKSLEFYAYIIRIKDERLILSYSLAPSAPTRRDDRRVKLVSGLH